MLLVPITKIESQLKSEEFNLQRDGMSRLKWSECVDTYVLSKIIAAEATKGPDDVTIFVDEYGIWKSSENWHLFEIVCRHFFQKEWSLTTARVVAGKKEAKEITDLVQIFILNGWGFWLYVTDYYWAHVSHERTILCSRDYSIVDYVGKVRSLVPA